MLSGSLSAAYEVVFGSSRRSTLQGYALTRGFCSGVSVSAGERADKIIFWEIRQDASRPWFKIRVSCSHVPAFVFIRKIRGSNAVSRHRPTSAAARIEPWEGQIPYPDPIFGFKGGRALILDIWAF